MCVCARVCVYARVCARVCVCVCVYTRVFKHRCMCAYWVCVCIRRVTFARAHRHASTCICDVRKARKKNEHQLKVGDTAIVPIKTITRCCTQITYMICPPPLCSSSLLGKEGKYKGKKINDRKEEQVPSVGWTSPVRTTWRSYTWYQTYVR